MDLESKIRVCIRGMSGLLGSRLALAVQKQPDMILTAGIAKGIVKDDDSLKRILNFPWNDGILPEALYIDGTHQAVQKLNESQSRLRFLPLEGLNLADVCDVVVDTTKPGNGKKWEQRFYQFGKPVIVQYGEYPFGRLIAPPLMEKSSNYRNVYRQGDCVLVAIAPILSPFERLLDSIRVHILMQYGQRLHDFPSLQRINATYLNDDLAMQMKTELGNLFRGKYITMEGILEVPALDYYTVTIHIDTNFPLTGKDVKVMLQTQPRIMIAPESMNSTYEIDHLLREERSYIGKDIPPIAVYGSDLDFVEPRRSDIRIRAAIYSRLIAVYPNIDSIRILAKGMNPIEAMRLTDKYAGFEHNRQ